MLAHTLGQRGEKAVADPTGKFLYVANNGASTMSAFNSNTTASNDNSVFISAVGTGAAPELIVAVGHP